MLAVLTRARTLGVSLALLTASAGILTAVPTSAKAPPGPITWGVQAGNFDFVNGQEVTAFYPARITVHPGDSVKFTPEGGHTVTFNPVRLPGQPTFLYGDPAYPNGPTAPTLGFANRPGGALLNSGGFGSGGGPGPGGPSSYTLPIASDAAGSAEEGTTYKYLCMFHREMAGFISVLPAGEALPSTDAKNQVRAAAAMKADLARGKRALARATSDAEGTDVAAGLGLTSVQGVGANSILRFAPATIEIAAGQSVTWVNKDINAPHTVTFGKEIPGPPGAPPGLAPPPGFLPYGGGTINSPADQVNSGFLVSQQLIAYFNVSSLFPPGFVVTRTVTFKFPNAGTYPYTCALHETQGMTGTVVVRPQDTNGVDRTQN